MMPGLLIIKNLILTVITFLLLSIIMPTFLIPCFFLSLFPKNIRYDNRLYFWLTSTMSRLMIWATFIKIRVIGRENLASYPNNPAIIIANHTSAIDIPLVEMFMGTYPHIWMSKVSYLRVPLMGFLLKRMHVFVDKTSGKDARAALLAMYALIKASDRHAVLFPEGTRHTDGKIHDFYAGFGMLAQKLKRPVIPIVIFGLHKVFPKKSLLVDSSACTVTIKIGKPMYCPESMDTAEFVAHIQQYYQTELEKLGA